MAWWQVASAASVRLLRASMHALGGARTCTYRYVKLKPQELTSKRHFVIWVETENVSTSYHLFLEGKK